MIAVDVNTTAWIGIAITLSVACLLVCSDPIGADDLVCPDRNGDVGRCLDSSIRRHHWNQSTLPLCLLEVFADR